MHGHGAVLLALLVIAPPAGAAEPERGFVSAGKPALNWRGLANAAPLVWANPVFAGQGLPIPCHPVFCDTFTLDVRTSADLAIESSSCADPVTQIEVEEPDGTRIFADGFEYNPRTIIEIPAAPTGRYVVRTLVNKAPGKEGRYVGHATLYFDQPEAVTLTVVSGRILRGRARRGVRMRVELRTTGPVARVAAELKRRGVVGASGRQSWSRPQGAVSVRVRRALSPGAYRLRVQAYTADNNVAARASGLVRVSRRQSEVVGVASSARANSRSRPARPASGTRC